MYLKNSFIDGQQLTKRKIQNLENGCRQLVGQEFNSDFFYSHGIKDLINFGKYWQSKSWTNTGTGTVTNQTSGASTLKFNAVNDSCSLVFDSPVDFTKNNSGITFSSYSDLFLMILSSLDEESYNNVNYNTTFRLKIHYDNYLTETNYSYIDFNNYDLVDVLNFDQLSSKNTKLVYFYDVGIVDITSVKGLSFTLMDYLNVDCWLTIMSIQLQKESIISPDYPTPYYEYNGSSFVEKYWSYGSSILTKTYTGKLKNYSTKFFKRINFANKYDFVVYAKIKVENVNNTQYQGIGIKSLFDDGTLNWSFYISKNSTSSYYTFSLTNEKSIIIASKQTEIQTLLGADILNFWLIKEGNNITGIIQCERLEKYHSYCCEFAELSNLVDVYFGNTSDLTNCVTSCSLQEFSIYGV